LAALPCEVRLSASSSKDSSTLPDRDDVLLRYLSSKLFMIQVQMI
jgi:hypothetical protein